MINSASVINCSLLNLKADLDALVAGGTKMFHIDIMDGHYVPNICLPLKLLPELRAAYPEIELDVHIMVTDPSGYVQRLADAGADYVCFHTDSTPFVRRTINEIRAAGMKPGIIINPSQRIDSILPFAPFVDMVMLMTVEPGFAGQPFLDGGMERLQEISEIRRVLGASFLINVDGGIDHEKGRQCKAMGVDVIVGTRYNIFEQPEGLTGACRRFSRELG